MRMMSRLSGTVSSARGDAVGEDVGAVLVLVTRFTTLMDDPLLPQLLREFRDALVIEQADRARIADELTGKARAS
jgi:hypothetical protein